MDEFFSVKQIQVWTTDLFHSEIKNVHINQTVHKIFWEAENRRLKSSRSHLRSSPIRDKLIDTALWS